MNEEDRKNFPKGYRRLTAEETASAKKRQALASEIAEIDRAVASQLARRADLDILLKHGPAAAAPAGEVLEIGGGEHEGWWVKE